MLEGSQMQQYIFTIALRIWHPDIDPNVISEELGLESHHSSMKGKPRRTPTGSELKGSYKESYWHSDLYVHGKDSPFNQDAETILIERLKKLQPYKKFLESLHSEGAKINLTLSSFSKKNYAFIFSPQLLNRCVELNLSLVHDVYPYEQNW